MIRTIINGLALLFALVLVACGGGSTVTAVSLEADNTDVALGGSTSLTAKSEQSITDNVTGEKVRFSFRVNESGGRLDVVNERLDGNGQAKAIFHAGTRAGYDIVQAAFDSGAIATVTLRVGTGLPVAPLELRQIGTNTLRVRVTDPRGLPIEGAMVNLSISVGTITPTSGTTDVNGILEATFTLPAGVTNAQVTATVQGQTVTATVSTADTSVASIHLSQRGWDPQNSRAQVQATALDRTGRPVPNVQINFTVRGAGTVTPPFGNTDVNGVLVANVTLPDGANSTQLVATSGGVTSTLTVQRIPSQLAQIRLEQFGWRVLATALDQSGTPVPGILINFRITTGTITPATATTNNNGVAEAVFTLPDEVNSSRVMASSGTVSNTLDVARPTRSGSQDGKTGIPDDTYNASSIRIEQEGRNVRVQLKDAEGQGIPWALLQFTMNPGTVHPVSLYTDADGSAVTTFSLPESTVLGEVTAEGAGATASLIVR